MINKLVGCAALSYVALTDATVAGDKGLERLSVLLNIAQDCQISLGREAGHWIDQLTSDLTTEARKELLDLADRERQRAYEQKGRIGACYETRATLYRDGLL